MSTLPPLPPPLEVVEDAIVTIERTGEHHRGRISPQCAEVIARQFHAVYEQLAPDHGWVTQERSRTPWEDLPEQNRSVMLGTVEALLTRGVILCGEHPRAGTS